jgi:hypothetical protein
MMLSNWCLKFEKRRWLLRPSQLEILWVDLVSLFESVQTQKNRFFGLFDPRLIFGQLL